MIAFGSMSRCPRHLGVIARGEGQRGVGAAGDRPSDTEAPKKHEALRFAPPTAALDYLLAIFPLVAENGSRDLKRVHELFRELDCSNAGSRLADDPT